MCWGFLVNTCNGAGWVHRFHVRAGTGMGAQKVREEMGRGILKRWVPCSGINGREKNETYYIQR